MMMDLRPSVFVRAAMSIVIMACFGLALWGNSGGSALQVEVKPEAHLYPSSAPLVFQVRVPGETAVSQAVPITAWVRSLAGEQIRLFAQAAFLTGPTGYVDPAAIRWTGSMQRALGGAKAAACTNGAVAAGLPQLLITGFNDSGIAVCGVSFALVTTPDWPSGTYTGRVDLALLIQ